MKFLWASLFLHLLAWQGLKIINIDVRVGEGVLPGDSPSHSVELHHFQKSEETGVTESSGISPKREMKRTTQSKLKKNEIRKNSRQTQMKDRGLLGKSAEQGKGKPKGKGSRGAISWTFARPEPIYPRLAQRRGLQGRVLVSIETGMLGFVKKASLKHSSGYGSLDQAALSAAKTWRLGPGLKATIPFEFRLENSN